MIVEDLWTLATGLPSPGDTELGSALKAKINATADLISADLYGSTTPVVASKVADQYGDTTGEAYKSAMEFAGEELQAQGYPVGTDTSGNPDPGAIPADQLPLTGGLKNPLDWVPPWAKSGWVWALVGGTIVLAVAAPYVTPFLPRR